MAITSIPIGAKPPAKFNYISSYNIITPYSGTTSHNATPEQLRTLLHDGVTIKTGAYGTTLFYGSSTYIEFQVYERCKFWATSGVYSDSGGSTGKDLNIYKYNEGTGTYVLYETAKTTSTEDWYILSNLLTIGKYRINAAVNYIQFNEFYFESISEQKSFIAQNDGYKVFNETIKSQVAENKVPLMTSNITPQGLANANAYWGTGYEPYKAFNRSKTNAAINGWATPSNTSKGWLSYTFQNIVYIEKYVITPREAVYAPISWIIEIDKGDGILEVMDTRTNVTSWSDSTDITFTLSKPFKCREFRINVFDSNGGGITIIQNMEIHSAQMNTVLSNWSAMSSSLPSLVQFKERGMLLPNLERKVQTLDPIKMDKRNDVIDTGDIGSVFSKTIDLKKYIDLRAITVEVK
ncbi:hypothetical protein ACIP9G_08590 [Lysinibacillus sp. NPDC093197]|uniref:hypothetical protein n=1 Tax=Lysinibacillus sp. NPDC093197 TaxID=3364132 RepID=UPI0037F3E225